MNALRLVDTTEDIPLIERPVAFTGNLAACELFATNQGYKWRSVPDMLFGGYYYHPETGDCLMPDTN